MRNYLSFLTEQSNVFLTKIVILRERSDELFAVLDLLTTGLLKLGVSTDAACARSIAKDEN